MHCLVYLETAVVLGTVVPVLLVLLPVQLLFDAVVLEWRLSRAPSSTGERPSMHLMRTPLIVHFVMLVFFQYTVTLLFFDDARLSGREVVVLSLPLGVLVLMVSWLCYRSDFTRGSSSSSVMGGGGQRTSSTASRGVSLVEAPWFDANNGDEVEGELGAPPFFPAFLDQFIEAGRDDDGGASDDGDDDVAASGFTSGGVAVVGQRRGTGDGGGAGRRVAAKAKEGLTEELLSLSEKEWEWG